MAKQKSKKAKKKNPKKRRSIPKCGLCGKRGNLTRTECCGQLICDDEDQYVVFSYSRNSCYRNHSRYTLCGFHYNEEHSGDWKSCQKCRDDIETEMYVYYGTNEYNFEKLENPPDYEPTRCSKCDAVIVLGDGGYSYGSEGYRCGKCSDMKFPDFTGRGN